MKTKILVKIHGNVNINMIEWIKGIIAKVYDKASSKGMEIPLIVELHIFENTDMLNTYIDFEALRMGVKAYSKGFIAYHDAWTGIPRLFFSVESLNKLELAVAEGVVEHESMHSIIHRDVRYYIVSIPLQLYELVNRDKMDINEAWGITYLASLVIKDYEVTLNLVKLGIIDNQVKYHEYLLKEASYNKLNEQLLNYLPYKLITILTFFKPIASAIPLLKTEHGNYVKSLIENYINMLPSFKCILRKLINVIPSILGDLDLKITYLIKNVISYVGY